MENAVELADMIAQLRSEIGQAMADGEGAGLRFRAERLELELTVVVERSKEPGGKVKFWVVEAGASARTAHLTTQRITLSLLPVTADTPEQPALISGAELPDED
ncbi:trypco2 family protein [Streptomyces boluensis]|uniref:Trypsin-co-occurring domain-containing protein n=1 Tax=Streptomyces boluensis TaxID=1775135 RepID=A0A964UUC3_9ACTN|nr:trypco2 family protein [Streptomyces boluensis]NBE55604.1 hypothetical protein [Streptomyces boluensis]